MFFKNATRSLFLLFGVFSVSPIHAGSYAWESAFRQIGENTVEVTFIQYADVGFEGREIAVSWDEENFEAVPTSNGLDTNNDGIPDGEIIDQNIRKLVFTATHTYEAPGQYHIIMRDPNRPGGICNINFPNSDQVVQVVDCRVTLLDDFAENNHSPVLLEPVIVFGNLGESFEHTVNAFDVDDDSLAYELEIPESAGFPEFTPAIDAETGKVTWDTPSAPCRFVFIVRVKAYRAGQLIDQVARDYVIDILNKEDQRPVLSHNGEEDVVTTVALGDTVRLELNADNPEAGELVEIISSGGLYDFFPNPAFFTPGPAGNPTAASFE